MPVQKWVIALLGVNLLATGARAEAVEIDADAAFLGRRGGGQLIRGTVMYHADGDTLTMKPADGGKPIKVRMVGIDTPELHLPVAGSGNVSQGHWAETAAERLAQLAPVGTRVTLETWGAQSYGRAIGRILDAKGRDINLQLVQEGWAAAYVICGGESCTPGFLNNQEVSHYMDACDRAVSLGLGIYDRADPLPEQPFEFRIRMQKKKPYRPVGDLRTGRLYPADQFKKVPLCRRIFFETQEDAQRMGFGAGSRAKPYP